MRDRHVLETVLIRRIPQATRDQVAAAANAIMALLDQWEADDRRELPLPDACDANEARRHGGDGDTGSTRSNGATE
jgi:hypothetical protein